MAITDAKPGFRLPWTAERGDTPAVPDSEASSTTEAAVDPAPDHEDETPAMIDVSASTASEATDVAVAPDSTPVATTPPPAPAPARKPNKLMADLTRAMQAAAEEARTDVLTRLGADAKAFIETIHATSATDATELRRQADDDVAGVREWSKAEIARIREKTEARISARKADLEQEIETHAAAIERRIERVQARVAAFETEMSEFFELLGAEVDPTRLAAMAENLPEPPSFDADMDGADVPLPPLASEPPVAETAEAETAEVETAEAEVAQPELEPADSHHVAWPSEAPSRLEADHHQGPANADLFSIGADESSADADATAGNVPAAGFAAAEAEAASFGDLDAESDTGSSDIAEEAFAARLAGLMSDGDGADTVTTRAIVVGLMSVASIAGFKRHLSRVPGVSAVGVTSSPDGEFVFAVTHTAGLDLQGAIATLPGFGARVTGSTDDELHVTARDPESQS